MPPMEPLVVTATLIVMAIGLAGTVLPFAPGIPIILAAGIGAWIVTGFGTAGWVTAIVLTVLAAAGVAAKYVLSSRTGAAAAVPRRSMVAGAAAGAVGMFVVPVVGFVLGGVGGVFVAELGRTGDRAVAWGHTRRLLRSFGLGMLLEVVAAMAMVLAFVLILWLM